MDPIDHRHAEWQHILHGAPRPAPQPGLVAPAVLLTFALLSPWALGLMGVAW